MTVFTRSDVIVAVAPHLFGRHPTELAQYIDAVCAHPDAIPLIGVATARERAFAPACVLANQYRHRRQNRPPTQRDNAPTVTNTVVAEAIAAKEESLGGRH